MVSITLGTIWQKRTAAAADLRTNAVVQYLGATAVTAAARAPHRGGPPRPVPALLVGLAWAVFGLSIGAIGLLLCPPPPRRRGGRRGAALPRAAGLGR